MKSFEENILDNLKENQVLVKSGRRPIHYSIPSEYFYTVFDPKYWDERDENYQEIEEMRRQTLRAMSDSPDYD